VGWLLRELTDARDDLLISALYPSAHHPVTVTLAQVREDRNRLLYASDPKRSPREFTVALVRPIGQKRGRGEGSFVSETRAQLLDFYRQVVQNIKPWQAKAPRLPDVPEVVPAEPMPEPPPFAASQERAFGDATAPEDLAEQANSALPVEPFDERSR
jgi:hypothetical protein